MKEKIFYIFIIVLGGIFLVNLALLDISWLREKKEVDFSPSPSPVEPTIVTTDICGPICQKIIDERISEVVSTLSGTKIIKEEKAKESKTETSSVKVVWLPLGDFGSTASKEWVDVPGFDFYFDLTEYPKIKSVRWEVSVESYLSSNPAYIRLYDITNKRAVDGSELATRLSSYEYLISGNLTIWRGNNLYRIQARGSTGNTVNFKSPRLKIILE